MHMSLESPLITIVGETASGKTAAAIELAKLVNGEIICADSRTVYKKMDIGTAKPSLKEQQEVPHHLINVVEPDETFNVAQFQREAQKCIQTIAQQHKMPIMVGGSGLYVDSILYDLQLSSEPDYTLRAQLEQMNDEELTTLLSTKNIDIGGVSTKNRRHLIRAIERGGTPQQEKKLRANTLVLGIRVDRAVLKQRVTARVQEMFRTGLIEEVKKIRDTYGKDIPALSAPGYKAVGAYLESQIDLEEAKEQFIRNDLQLAKRQRTWFKRSSDIQWFEDPSALREVALEFIRTQRV